MATFTPNKNLIVPAHNEFVDTWDTQAANPNYTTIDTAFSGTLSKNATGLSGTIALTQAEVVAPTIQISGAPVAAVTYTVPAAVGGVWIVRNTTTGGFSVGLASAAGGSTVTIPAGTQLQAWCDGTATGMLLSNTSPALTGLMLPYAGSVAPSWALLCFGQAVSRTTYANLFATIGTTYGTGDGVTTFNVPDVRGMVIAGKDDMGGAAAGRITAAISGLNGTVLGAAGGNQNLQAHAHTIPGQSITGFGVSTDTGFGFSVGSGTSSGVAGAGNSQNVQPTIIMNYIIGI